MSNHSLSMSGKLHMHLDHSQTALTLEIDVEFEWSLSVGHAPLEPHPHEVVINNMANVCLERLEQLDNLPRNNRNENRNYNFNYEMYDEEQFRSRFRLTKDGFREMLRGPLSKIHPSVFGRKNKFSSYFVYELDFGQY